MSATGRSASAAHYTIHAGDCLDPVSGLVALPAGAVDVTITDPPYSEHVHEQSRRGVNGSRRCGGAKDEISARRVLGFASLTAGVRQGVAAQLARVTRRWVLVFSDVEGVDGWRLALEAAGLEYLRTMAWVKIGGAPQFTGDRPAVGFEAIVVAHRRGRKTWNGGGKAGIYSVPTAIDREHSGDARTHTAQKPVDLMRALVADFSSRGEIVLDPFAGSGTTGVAALEAGRRFLGWEMDRRYAEIAERRLAGTREQRALFPDGGRRRAKRSDQGELELAVPITGGAR